MSTLKLAAAACLVISVAACASRRAEGDDQSRETNNNGGFLNAAATPLRDVGLIRPDVPEILQSMNYPYQQNDLAQGCPSVLYEIGRLDAILGEESYQPGVRANLYARVQDAAGDAAVGAVAGAAADMVPYRSWVRRLSGASRAEREAAAKYALGEQRRAFLRGYGAALGCPGVVPAPPPPEQPRRDDDEDD